VPSVTQLGRGELRRRAYAPLHMTPPLHLPAVAVVPVKDFRAAKGRLAGVLDEATRARLARALAGGVVAAAAPLPVAVVCEDDAVADWARSAGAAVIQTAATGLDDAVGRAVERLAAGGVVRAVVVHADLAAPVALTPFAVAVDADEVLVVPDRHGDGTNVLSVPTGRGFVFRYGPGSATRHVEEAERCGLRVRVVTDERLGWDVDGPEDLRLPGHLGVLPGLGPVSGSFT
jgi:2-phospho-L-lactate/phosphoenolpyruvate guanylyltransferase